MRVCATVRESQDELLSYTSAGGVTTNCDPYVYAFDYDELVYKIIALIDAYDAALARVELAPRSACVRRQDRGRNEGKDRC